MRELLASEGHARGCPPLFQAILGFPSFNPDQRSNRFNAEAAHRPTAQRTAPPMSEPNDFEKASTEQSQSGFLGELWGFMRDNKKWWLLPIVVMLLVFGLLVFLSGTGLAPFIYTLF